MQESILKIQNDNIVAMNNNANILYKELKDMNIDTREKFEYFITNYRNCVIYELQTEINQKIVNFNSELRNDLEKKLTKKIYKQFQK